MADVHIAIGRVMSALAKMGISKSHDNQSQGYKFRGIDDVYNALAPLLSEHGLLILPRVTERTVSERESSRGGALFSVTVKVEYDFVAVSDGSVQLVSTYGEAMDSGDKATNKALSAAYKYACIQAFCIPVQGESPDSDEQTHSVKAKPKTSGGLTEEKLLDMAATAAGEGIASYRTFWNVLTPAQKNLIGEKRHADFKILAEEVEKGTGYVPE